MLYCRAAIDKRDYVPISEGADTLVFVSGSPRGHLNPLLQHIRWACSLELHLYHASSASPISLLSALVVPSSLFSLSYPLPLFYYYFIYREGYRREYNIVLITEELKPSTRRWLEDEGIVEMLSELVIVDVLGVEAMIPQIKSSSW